jgi:hypothetical protein
MQVVREALSEPGMRQAWLLKSFIVQLAFLAVFVLAGPGGGAAGEGEALRLELTGQTGGLADREPDRRRHNHRPQHRG